MESLETRISIFTTSGIITKEEANILRKWIEIINQECTHYELETLERIITHSAMMMKRKRENESLELLNEEIFKSIKASPNYSKGLEIYNQMKTYYEVSESEERYMILHICTLLG